MKCKTCKTHSIETFRKKGETEDECAACFDQGNHGRAAKVRSETRDFFGAVAAASREGLI